MFIAMGGEVIRLFVSNWNQFFSHYDVKQEFLDDYKFIVRVKY